MDDIIDAIASPQLRELFRFLSSPGANGPIEAFFAANAFEFGDGRLGSLESIEHPVRWGELHTEYCALVNELLEGFCNEHVINEAALHAEARAAVGNLGEDAADPIASALFDTFLATFDYRCFVGVMATCAERITREEGTERRHARRAVTESDMAEWSADAKGGDGNDVAGSTKDGRLEKEGHAGASHADAQAKAESANASIASKADDDKAKR